MGKFRNGELTTGFIELGVNFRDFALHYGLPPSDPLSACPGSNGHSRRRGGALTSTSSRFSSTTMAHGDSTAARFLASNPRRRLQTVLSRQLHDLALRGSWPSTVVMESRAQIDRDRLIGNTVSLVTEAMVNSPLRNLPIRQVMGNAHYLSKPQLPQMPIVSSRRVVGETRIRTSRCPVFSCRLYPA